jgi:hypothetical protein
VQPKASDHFFLTTLEKLYEIEYRNALGLNQGGASKLIFKAIFEALQCYAGNLRNQKVVNGFEEDNGFIATTRYFEYG